MNKKVLIIGGGVVVLGAIGYLYFTNKKKQDALLSGGTSGAGSTSATTQTGATSGASDGGIAPLPKGSTITPTTVDGVTTSVITTPNSALTVQNQMELDAILDNIKRNIAISKSSITKALSGGFTAKEWKDSKGKIELLKNDLLKLGYEVKEGSNGIFLVKL